MASSQTANAADADDFVRNLLGLTNDADTVVDSNALADEIRNIEARVSGDGDSNALADEISNIEARVSGDGDRLFQCPKCGKNLCNRFSLRRHLDHGSCRKRAEHRCEKCNNKRFCSRYSLKRHLESAHSSDAGRKDTNRCEACLQVFSTRGNVNKHLRNGNCKNVCCQCSQKIQSVVDLRKHIQRHMDQEYLTVPQLRALRKQMRQLTANRMTCQSSSRHHAQPAQQRGDSSDSDSSSDSADRSDNSAAAQEQIPSPGYEQERTTNFSGSLVRFKIKPTGEETCDMMLLFANKRRQLSDNIKNEMKRLRGVKWYVVVNVKMTKYSPDGDVKDQASTSFRSVSQTVLRIDEIPNQLDAAYFKVCDSLESFKSEGSGWRLDDILLLEQTVLKYNPLRGSCSDYVLPECLKRKACLLSVVGAPGNSMECFRWSVLAGLYAPPTITGEIHWSDLSQHRNSLNFHGIENTGKRMPLTQVSDFEKQNDVSINILGYVSEPFPLYISKNLDRNKNRHVNLLLISYSGGPGSDAESDGHYCLIQDMSRLLCAEKVRHNGRLFYCMRCLNPKYGIEKLREHERFCSELQPLYACVVTEDKKWVEFKNYRRQLECPFFIVADFECYSRKLYDIAEPTEGHTVRERRLEPCAFAYIRISRNDSHPSEPVVYVGKDPEDTMMHFLKCMEEEEQYIFQILSQKQPAVLCDTGVKNLMKSNDACHVCDTPFLPGDKICADHDHITGEFTFCFTLFYSFMFYFFGYKFGYFC